MSSFSNSISSKAGSLARWTFCDEDARCSSWVLVAPFLARSTVGCPQEGDVRVIHPPPVSTACTCSSRFPWSRRNRMNNIGNWPHRHRTIPKGNRPSLLAGGMLSSGLLGSIGGCGARRCSNGQQSSPSCLHLS